MNFAKSSHYFCLIYKGIIEESRFLERINELEKKSLRGAEKRGSEFTKGYTQFNFKVQRKSPSRVSASPHFQSSAAAAAGQLWRFFSTIE